MRSFLQTQLNNAWKIVLAIAIIEWLSFVSYQVDILNSFIFVVILVLVGIISFYKLEYGLLIALAELMIGSKGYLFWVSIGSFDVSIRLGIFIVVFIVWAVRYLNIKKYLEKIKTDPVFRWFIVLMLFIVFGVINGIISGNGLRSVFFDFNGYLFFGLFFVFLETVTDLHHVSNILKIFWITVIWVSIKTMLLLYYFSHSLSFHPGQWEYIYRWVRDTGVGEITYAGSGFWRIFFQSQIFELAGIIIGLSILAYLIKQSRRFSEFFKTKKTWVYLVVVIVSFTSVLISFSRSFWLGALAGLFVFGLFLIFLARFSFSNVLKSISVFIGILVVSIGLLMAVVHFPYPNINSDFAASMIRDRLTTISGEAAASSRWNLLGPLTEKIQENPILGSGFGTTVTFQTEDPRIKNEENPDGWYTTMAFEWGYLDTMTEIGGLGILIYLIFIFYIVKSAWRGFINRKHEFQFLYAGLLIGLVVVLVTHGFSPYLNHPLGIGYLMICSSIFSVLNNKS